MKCPNPKCRADNEDFYTYCMTCGFPLHEQKPVPRPAPIVEPRPEPPPPEQTPPGSLTSGAAGGGSEALVQHPGEDLFTGGSSPPVGEPSSVLTQPESAPVTVIPAPTPRPERRYGEGGRAPLNPWGPFAGYGTRRRHTGWLMDSQGSHADELVSNVEHKFSQRKIPHTAVVRRTLTARGVLVENRPYFLLRRGLATVALYIAAFGEDLFISLASYLKPPISPLRVLILLAMVAFQFFMYFLFPVMFNQRLNDLASSVLNPFGGVPDVGGLLALSCLVGPLGLVNTIALILFALYSLYKYLTERDILAGLRVPPNEFNEDDLMAMEKAAEQTVRIALTDIRLNPDDLRVASVRRAEQLF